MSTFNKAKLYETLLQLTEEQQQIAWEYIEKTAEANMALKRLAVLGANEIDLEADAGNIGFSAPVNNLAENAYAFEIFHTVGKRFCKKDFGGITEAEQKVNIDNMILKKGTVLGRYFIGGANLCVVLDYAKPEEVTGKFMIQVMLSEEYGS